jgi:drug/metabolite transporter (DMT)-like permease
MTASQWASLVVLSVLWGGTFFFVAIAVADVPPFTLVFLRVSLAAIALLVFVYATGGRFPRNVRVWGGLAIMGLFNNILPFGLIFWGQTHISSGLASILNATTPLFSVVFAHFLARNEPLTAARLAGAFLGLAGVAAMTGIELLDGASWSAVGQFAVIGAAALYALTGIFGRRFRDLPPPVTAAGQLTCAALLSLPLALIVDQPWTLPFPKAETVGAIVCMAVISTSLAYVMYFRLLAAAGATNLLLVTFLIPISALLLGITVLGETLEPRHVAGMALIAAGLAAIDGRVLQVIRGT